MAPAAGTVDFPGPTVGSGVTQSPSCADTREYVHTQPTPAVTTTPTAAPVPASENAAPAPPRNPTASILDRDVRELGYEADVRMPGSTRVEPRAMRESLHNVGLMFHAALAQGIATREAFDEAFREHELPPPNADFPTAPASDVPTPSTVAEAELSEHAAIWRDSRTRSSAACYRPTRSAPRSNQSIVSLTQSGCSVGSRMNSVK